MARHAFLALGSNLGDRRRYLRDAIARLTAAEGVNLLRQSRVYETEAVGPVEQGPFLNLVIEVELAEEITPRQLLALAKKTEREVGRQARVRWGPREIDIDVLLIDDEKACEPDFTLPHPRMWERAFVMAPLADLAPTLSAPGGETVAELAARLGEEQGIHATVHL